MSKNALKKLEKEKEKEKKKAEREAKQVGKNSDEYNFDKSMYAAIQNLSRIQLTINKILHAL